VVYVAQRGGNHDAGDPAPRSTSDRLTFSAKCQAEEWSLVTDILIYVFEPKTPNEVSKRMETGNKNKISQQNRNSILTECEVNIGTSEDVSDYETNT